MIGPRCWLEKAFGASGALLRKTKGKAVNLVQPTEAINTVAERIRACHGLYKLKG